MKKRPVWFFILLLGFSLLKKGEGKQKRGVQACKIARLLALSRRRHRRARHQAMTAHNARAAGTDANKKRRIRRIRRKKDTSRNERMRDRRVSLYPYLSLSLQPAALIFPRACARVVTDGRPAKRDRPPSVWAASAKAVDQWNKRDQPGERDGRVCRGRQKRTQRPRPRGHAVEML